MTRVLVVEDDPAAREGVGIFLERCGYEVRLVADANGAYASTRGWPPDVAVCDWQLDGDQDGVDVARRLQHAYGSAIVLFTSHPLARLRREASDVIVENFLRKPVPPNVLLAAVSAATPGAARRSAPM